MIRVVLESALFGTRTEVSLNVPRVIGQELRTGNGYGKSVFIRKTSDKGFTLVRQTYRGSVLIDNNLSRQCMLKAAAQFLSGGY